ncbi:MAG: metallophosphoesterase [Chlamydiales bacterium]|nr:metallophosphoesterase [Chlamydiales bacterium]
MAIWAIADLHLSLGIVGKEMHVFGPEWIDHHKKIQAFWDEHVKPEDLVLIPGDISWAMKQEEAKADLDWIHARPGTKYIIRGNHDYWCKAPTKVRKELPSSIHLIWSDAALWNDVAICGTRLWDSPEYDFGAFIEMKKPLREKKEDPQTPEEKQAESDAIFNREVMRLEMALNAMDKNARLKIAMVHYPPISADLQPSRVSAMLEKANVNQVVFGHLHSVRPESKLFGTKNGVAYHFVACDWLNFRLQKIAD